MDQISRYRVGRGVEGEHEAGSRGRVLRNLRGIITKRKMDQAEYDALLKAQRRYLSVITQDTRFTARLLCQMHRAWLGGVYAWAGRYRTVELTKGGFRWPPARLVRENMARFARSTLRRHTPCRPAGIEDAARKIAVVHAELLLIHPFRDGNGRLARWVADLMSLQAGLSLPDYGFRGAKGRRHREAYLKAVRAGYLGDYRLLRRFFAEGLARTVRAGRG